MSANRRNCVQSVIENDILSNNLDATNGITSYLSLQNKDVELIYNYFDVVPDGNLYTKIGSPIFVVRLKSKGLEILANYYKKKYDVNIKILKYLIKYTNRNTIYSSDISKLITIHNLAKKINFTKLNNNQQSGVIISLLNNEKRLMHGMSIVYGKKNNGKKFVIFGDPYYEYQNNIDEQSSVLVLAKYFNKNFNDIDIYCQNLHIQADHHCCAVVSTDFVKNCLINNGKILKEMIDKSDTIIFLASNINDTYANVIANNRNVNDISTLTDLFIIHKYYLHSEFLKLSHLNSTICSDDSMNRYDKIVSKNNIDLKEYVQNNNINCLYYKEPHPYNPNDYYLRKINDMILKQVNATLIKKAHKYAKIIMEETKFNNIEYSPNYWLELIKKHKINK